MPNENERKMDGRSFTAEVEMWESAIEGLMDKWETGSGIHDIDNAETIRAALSEENDEIEKLPPEVREKARFVIDAARTALSHLQGERVFPVNFPSKLTRDESEIAKELLKEDAQSRKVTDYATTQLSFLDGKGEKIGPLGHLTHYDMQTYFGIITAWANNTPPPGGRLIITATELFAIMTGRGKADRPAYLSESARREMENAIDRLASSILEIKEPGKQRMKENLLVRRLYEKEEKGRKVTAYTIKEAPFLYRIGKDTGRIVQVPNALYCIRNKDGKPLPMTKDRIAVVNYIASLYPAETKKGGCFSLSADRVLQECFENEKSHHEKKKRLENFMQAVFESWERDGLCRLLKHENGVFKWRKEVKSLCAEVKSLCAEKENPKGKKPL